MDLETLLRKHADRLLNLPNVVGVGQGEKNGQPVIKVFVTHKVPLSALEEEEVIPLDIEGVEVDVEETGIIGAEE
ncbi:hypothetical protein [Calidithermus roseus]|uniref:Uncharacterized protein n=1 Tax=Calidithermus roseus TaxID=1644118 RepID=A0A399ENF2_9DEIN|nr:hypothetical protein [Calidithermus roseus]RIH86137.1 hypothetical protein Mrose_01911 [Calidithermus roseus]